jgi:adenylosuccinate lyase
MLIFLIAELFNGDHEKVKTLNKMVCEKMGFTKWQQVSGQTYTRKLDYMVLSALSGLAQSAYKMCGDIRLLASMKEIGKVQLCEIATARRHQCNRMSSSRMI